MADRIVRYFEDKEIRAVASEGNRATIVGHAAVFNQEVQIGHWFKEVIDARAFDNADMSDVFLFVNHKVDVPLARAIDGKESTMILEIDEKGLLVKSTLDIANNADSQKLYSAIQRGDISGMSFAFCVDTEEWRDLDDDMPLRIIKSIKKVFEVSAVTFPAYSGTDISARDEGKAILEAARKKYPTAKSLNEYRNKIELIGGMKL